jgi:FkbM family methyltransferase
MTVIPADTFTSYAQNGEDVVLWRALGGVPNGRYIDIGANDPTVSSVSRAFYDRGWSGIAVEPDPDYARRFRSARPRDVVVEAVASDAARSTAVLHRIQGTGLSTIAEDVRTYHESVGRSTTPIPVLSQSIDQIIEAAGFADEPIHFMSVDTEGSEASVLRSIDLARFRPWVIVVEATAPNTTVRTHAEWEPLLLEADYRLCLFDGLSRYYVAAEHEALRDRLDYPVCIFDDFVTAKDRADDVEFDRLHRAVADESTRADRAEAELERVRSTLSWRLTTPLRALRRRAHRAS